MKVAVLGTGMVGRALAGRLAELGNDAVIGTRDVEATLARTESDAMGNPPFSEWHAEHPDIALSPFATVASDAQIVINATSGEGALDALKATGAENLAGKTVIDVSNPLDFSEGFPPILSVANTDSVAERIQAAFPDARVVKALNTVNASVMVDPSRVPGEHNLFVAGEDPAAKNEVKSLLAQFGWSADQVLDVGGIRSARGLEMYLPLWLSLMGSLGTADFNIAVVRA